jgi:DNA polymerase V
MYGLVDCNNFFASCERVFRPDLTGKPVIVLSNNDGCIIARSNEAKKLGIKMGQPLYQVKDIVEKNKVAVFSSNYILYNDMSKRVHSLLKMMVPNTEVYSIDESFINLEGIPKNQLAQLGKTISETIREYTGIPVSVGIAPTKTLAKIAAELCKKYPKLQGSCFLHKPQDIEKVLRKFPVGDVWGIGRRYTKKLNAMNVFTAWDFVQLPASRVQKEMTIMGLKTRNELLGTPCIEFIDHSRNKLHICTSRSFAKEISELPTLIGQVALFTTIAAEKLRKQGSVCGEIVAFLHTNYHKKNEKRQFEARAITLPMSTDSTVELIKAASEAVKQIFRNGYPYKKAGIFLTHIQSKDAIQTAMFTSFNYQKHTKLMATIDNINKKQGTRSVISAASSSKDVLMNRNHLSPQYTTKWDEILVVR